MKKLIGPILLCMTALAPLVATGAPAPEPRAQATAEANVNLHIEGMHCASCPITVRTVLRRLDGVKDVTVSVADKRARVAYDPRRVTPERMAQAVTDAGYATTVERGSGG